MKCKGIKNLFLLHPLPVTSQKMSSATDSNEDKLTALFETWQAVQDVSKLDRESCQKHIDFLNDDSKTIFVIDSTSNSEAFTRKFSVGNSMGAAITRLIDRKLFELEMHIKNLPAVIDLHLKNAWQEASEESKTFFIQYDSLQNTGDYSEFIELFRNIYSKEYNWLPWIFICGSSGTGKTQLAFSLPRNKFFFLMAENHQHQPIYSPFKEISKILLNFIKEDLAALKEKQVSAENIAVEAERGLINRHTVSRTANFILFLIEKFLSLDEPDWLASEVKLDLNTTIEVLKPIQELKEDLARLIPIPQKRPIIFLDECSGEPDEGPFHYIRAVLRLIVLIPVFMGTNADACKIITRSQISRSYSEKVFTATSFISCLP